jgi:exosortase
MASKSSEKPAAAADAGMHRLNLWAYSSALLSVILAWLVLITQVRHHWGGESYYNFGWFVPPLSLWLLYRNLQGLTPIARPRSGWIVAVAAVAVLLVVPFHAFSEVNPFWRLPLWIQAFGIFIYSLLVFYGLYGRAGIRAALFPLFFLCTMIPWPYRIEQIIVMLLTKVVVSFTLSGLHLMGYPVIEAGNSFVLGELQIGVNEACSGIRSLQALFMISLFLGSLFGQGWLQRGAALVCLPLIIIVTNTLRAMFLATQVIVHGDSAYDKWHDPAGYIAFGASMLLIYACIELLNFGGNGKAETALTQPVEILRRIQASRINPRFLLLPIIPVLLYSSVEGWFRVHEAGQTNEKDWTLKLPDESKPNIRYLEIPDQVAGLLGYSFGHRFFYGISSIAGSEFYYYGYEEENKLASVSSYGHSPAICMESIGATMLEQFDDLIVNSGPTSLSMKHYLFQLGDQSTRMHVFWTVWEKRNMDISHEELASLDYRTQWKQLLKGRRDFSRKVLLVSLAGIKDAPRARDTIGRIIAPMIVTGPDSAGTTP